MTLHIRRALDDLIPYEPGKPAEELMREKGLSHVVKLASNEGPWGPFPAVAEVIANGIESLNRYPDGSCYLLRDALAQRHGVDIEHVIVGHGADSIINNLSFSMLDPGDNIVCGWPSFPSYVLDARKAGAEARMVPLRSDLVHDLPAMSHAIDDRTRMIYICNPNNPTGTMVPHDELEWFCSEVPENVLIVLDEAYFEYVQSPQYTDGIESIFKKHANICVLRTFSKIHGLAGLRVGYAVAPSAVVRGVGKVRNAFDVTSLAQEAAIASLECDSEVALRASVTREEMERFIEVCRSSAFDPVPSVANFFCLPLGAIDGREVYERLLDHGVIIRPLNPFGMSNAVRITIGSPQENNVALEAIKVVMADYAACGGA